MEIRFFENVGLDNTRVVVGTIVIAAVVYLLRMFPIVVFKKKITNRYLNSFLAYLPYAVLTSLVFPEVFYSISSSKMALTPAELIATTIGFIVAVILAFRNRNLAIVIIVTTVVAFIVMTLLGFMPFEFMSQPIVH